MTDEEISSIQETQNNVIRLATQAIEFLNANGKASEAFVVEELLKMYRSDYCI